MLRCAVGDRQSKLCLKEQEAGEGGWLVGQGSHWFLEKAVETCIPFSWLRPHRQAVKAQIGAARSTKNSGTFSLSVQASGVD